MARQRRLQAAVIAATLLLQLPSVNRSRLDRNLARFNSGYLDWNRGIKTEARRAEREDEDIKL